ncbi:MAG: FAD:protein FMN transferase [Methylovulum sp.]|uniref:FAD:protein FMN transferase n=1 Tax=Methylovulum sp. TaxID=1916980 RepID=UPI00261C04A4|nr:FAD:protein FMN transferase [Methylovulum sp.]MDD2723055.1 FAD:protein FMN transferase [Methylovulum sp.]MDD5123756.1 FAD:protein FMN transferase [Methylovulum sp.]
MNHYFYHFPYKPSLILTVIFLLWGCDQPTVQKISGEAQGTTYHISFWSAQATDMQAIKQAVDGEFKRIDQLLSNYRPDSAIEQLNATVSSEPQAVNEEIIALIEQARIVSIASAGCYDLTIKPLFDLWGFKANKFSPPAQKTLQSTLQEVGFEKIEILDKNHLRRLNPELKIDLSSIAQGYSVGRIAALLEQQGMDNYLVEIGGELQTRGQKPGGEAWRIALEKPLSDERTMQKIITIEQAEPMTVMTSGTYRHYFDDHGKRYSHILDARRGIPVEHNTVSVTVFHNDPTQADAWSTALLCLGRMAGLDAANKAGIAALFIEQQDKSFNEFNSTALQALHTVTIK